VCGPIYIPTIFVNYHEHIITYKKLTVASRLTTLTTQDRASPSLVSPPSLGACMSESNDMQVRDLLVR